MKLAFGKFKGQELNDTPVWYQNWLNDQTWFTKPVERPLHRQLNGWDGHGRKGEAVYDAIFEHEKNEPIKIGIECPTCGSNKSKDEKYCDGDRCYYSHLY